LRAGTVDEALVVGRLRLVPGRCVANDQVVLKFIPVSGVGQHRRTEGTTTAGALVRVVFVAVGTLVCRIP